VVSRYRFAFGSRETGPEAYDFFMRELGRGSGALTVVEVAHVGSSLPSLFAHCLDHHADFSIGLPGFDASTVDGLVTMPFDPPLLIDLVLAWRVGHDAVPLEFLRSLPGWQGETTGQAAQAV